MSFICDSFLQLYFLFQTTFCVIFFILLLCSMCFQALVNEAFTYLALQRLWGVYVPHLVVWGTIAQGQLVFIAIEFISGIELCPRKFNSCFP
jgi:hypothetical protein